MTRIGINPARGVISDYRPARVSLCLLTYIPGLEGYFKDRFEILKLVLASLQTHTTTPYDLLVFDNGSCNLVVDYLKGLQENGAIRYLLLAGENIGKIGALRILFNAAPGQVIAYSDDDILFYPGWLEAHLQILDQFPQVGMVSGLPVRNAARHAHRSLDALIQDNLDNIKFSQGRIIPEEWEIDWAISTGRNPGDHLQATQTWQDTLLTLKNPVQADGQAGAQAIAGANHFQFVGPKNILLQALPEDWSGRLMGWMVELDEAIDNLGYLRLSTIARYTRHLGNILSAEMIRETQALGLLSETGGITSLAAGQPRRRSRLLRLPGSRRVLMAIYRRLFDILYR